MARGTRLYQQPRSPLIQGHSARERPFWQPWLVGVLVVGAWIAATVVLSAADNGAGAGSVFRYAAQAWQADLPWLIGGGIIGSALGVAFAKAWGFRARWLLAILFGVGGGYLLSWAAWAVGRLNA